MSAPQLEGKTTDTLLSLGRVADRTMLQFRRVPTGFAGGPSHYLVHVRDGGGFTVQPMQRERGKSDPRLPLPVRTTTRPLDFETVAVGRDGLASSAGRATAAGQEIRIERSRVTEIVRNTDEGVEHSWRFGDRPGGTADLVIEIAVSGAPMLDEGPRGLLFIDPATRLGVRYGVATWVAADGAKTTVQPTWDAARGRIAIRVPARVVERSAYPAVLDPTLTPEQQIECGPGAITMVQTCSAPVHGDDSFAEAAAYDPVHDQFLVVWTNRGVWGQQVKYNAGAVQLIGPGCPGACTNLAFDTDVANYFGAGVSFDGTQYVVAYNAIAAGNQQTFLRRVDSTGTVTAPVTVHAGVDDGQAKIVSAPGGNSLIVYTAGINVWGIFVPLGATTGFSTFLIANQGTSPDVAAEPGGTFLEADLDLTVGRVQAHRVSAGPTVTGVSPLTAGSGGRPRIDFGGGTYLVVWGDSRRGNNAFAIPNGDIYGALVSPSGTDNSSAGGFLIYTPAGTTRGTNPDVAWDGANFVVSIVDAAADNSIGSGMIRLVSAAGTPGTLTPNVSLATENRSPVRSDGHGRTLYTYVIPTSLVMQPRSLFYLSSANGAACTGGAGCDTGNCVGGVCCNTACNPPNATTTCTTGTCAFVGCTAGFANCDGTPLASGCNVNVTADVNNCGGCGTAAAVPNNAFICSSNHITTPTCAAGACNGACDVGWGDCNGSKSVAGNGCETALTAIPNCGACGATCNDGLACTTDVCNIVGATGVCFNVNATACAAGCSAAVGCGFVDTDGDGLNDTWETNHYIDNNCNGINDAGDTPLPGANVNEPDVYVKFDYMVKTGVGAHSHQPSGAAMAMVQAAYAGHHTHLHLFPASDSITENAVVSLNAPGTLVPACTGADAVSFYTLKAAHFPISLRPAYHYAIFSHYNTCDSIGDCAACPATPKTGSSPPFGRTGISELPGNDFIVSLGQLVDLGVPIADIVNAGTFMHELGHNLSLHHGGTDDLIQKPNYLSVMNYSYQFGIGTTAAPGPYPSSTVDPSTAYHIDYSTFAAGPLREGVTNGMNACINNGSGGMSEPAGIVGAPAGDTDVVQFYASAGSTTVYGPSNATPLDWDNTPPATDLHVYSDVSGDGVCSVLTGFNDWAQSSPGVGVFQDTNFTLGFQCNTGFWADGAPPPSQIEDREITVQQVLTQRKVFPFLHVQIDVRPGCGTNWIALGSPGLVSVAALGSASFDVAQVDPTSLRFAGAAPLSTSIADVNGDGFNDIVGVFAMSALQLSAASTTASLTGALQSSQAFGGTDTITLVPYPGPVVTIHDDGSGYAVTLRPPDHRFAKLSLANCVDSAVDRCGNPLNVNQAGHVVRITSDEEDHHGRGHDDGDDEDFDDDHDRRHCDEHPGDVDMVITGSSTFRLERERNSCGDGRVYTVTFDVSDADGNTSEWQCKIQVPRHKRGPAIDSGPQECVGSGCP